MVNCEDWRSEEFETASAENGTQRWRRMLRKFYYSLQALLLGGQQKNFNCLYV
jgi:hypothetical protein